MDYPLEGASVYQDPPPVYTDSPEPTDLAPNELKVGENPGVEILVVTDEGCGSKPLTGNEIRDRGCAIFT